MLTAFERAVAFRYLRARREEGMISVIALFSLVGIALGVMTLIVVLSVMNGVRDEMTKSIIGLEGHVMVYSNLRGISDYDALAAQLAENKAILSATPKVEGQVMASAKGQAVGALVGAYRNNDLSTKPLLLTTITDGDIDAFKRGEGVIIGKRLAEKMRLNIGDTLTLISPEGRATIAGTVPRVKAYPVVAMFSVGMFSYDNGLILMPFDEAQRYFKLRDEAHDAVSSIEVMTHDPDKAKALARELSAELGADYRTYDWKTTNAHIFRAVIVQRNVMFVILLLIILVACFNIISSLIMLVREKGRDIAILRTIGATRHSILKIFISCGVSVGVIGTLGGVCAGLAIAFNTEMIQHAIERATGQPLFADELYFLSKLPAKVDSYEVMMVVILSLTLSFLATLYPAWRAANMNPAEGLRYE